MKDTNKIGFWKIVNHFLKINNFSILSCYPGSNSSGLIDMQETSSGINLNEKIAFEIAYGSSLSGKRSVVSMKNVGLNVCADSFLNSIQTGVNAPLFLFVIDDVKVFSSQNKQDSRIYLDFFGGFCIEPDSLETVPLLLNDALKISLEARTPCVFRITNDLLDGLTQPDVLNKCEAISESNKLSIQNPHFLVHPKNWKIQQDWKNKRLKLISALLRESEVNIPTGLTKESKSLNVVVGAISPEVKGDIVHIRSYPLNYTQLKELFSNYARIEVWELGNPYVYEKIRSLHKEVISHLEKDSDNSHRIFFSDRYKLLFQEVNKIKDKMVFGDLNMFSNESEGIYDSILCLGGSIASAMGASLSGKNNVFAILGDGGFMHSAIISYLEAFHRGIDLIVIIIDNNGSHSTGGHKLPLDVRSILNLDNTVKSDFKNLDSITINTILTKLLETKGTKLWYIKDEDYKNEKFK